MQIFSVNNSINHQSQSFKSSKDISLKYVLEKHAECVPQRVLQRMRELLQSGKELPQLYEVHKDVYAPLYKAKNLEEAKKLFPEISDVIDIKTLANNRSKAIKAVRTKMSLEKFTLDYIKKIFMMFSQPQLVKEYGFTNRNLVMWLNDKLHIKPFPSVYTKLVAMSNETENSRIAECSRRAIYRDPETQAKRQKKASEHHRSKDYRAKKRQEMIDFYKRNPEVSAKYSLISKRTWDMCSEIKRALSEYTKNCSKYVKKIMSKKISGKNLTEEERRIVSTYYKNFWDTHPEFKEEYRKARLKAIQEINAN